MAKNRVAGVDGFKAHDFVSLRDAFNDLYKSTNNTRPLTDLQGWEFTVDENVTKKGAYQVSDGSVISWVGENGKPADKTIAKWLSEICRLLQWLLYETFPLYTLRLADSVDRFIRHPHADREDFVRANLYSAFEEIRLGAQKRQVVTVETRRSKASIYNTQGLYIPRTRLTGLISNLSTSTEKEISRTSLIDLKSERLLRIKEVLKIFPISRSGWNQGVKDGIYPQPVRLSKRTVAWRESDILALVASRRGMTDKKS